jgi:cephalosporin hydroxylase
MGRSGQAVELGPTPIGEEDCRFLEEIVRKERPETTIETGFAFGFSGLTLIGIMLDIGMENPRHTAPDPC